MMEKQIMDEKKSTITKSISRQLRKNLVKTYQGWWQWHKMKKKITPLTAVIFLPQNDTRDNYYALLYADQFLEKHGFQEAVILTSDPIIAKVYRLFSSKIAKVWMISKKTGGCLLQYAGLYHFDHRFFIASLTMPLVRHADRLVGVKNISYAEVFSMGVYRLDRYEPLKAPKYKGNDSNIKRFLALGE